MSPFAELLSRFLLIPSKKALGSAMNQKALVIEKATMRELEAGSVCGGAKSARRAR
jgi:hypothetical protein